MISGKIISVNNGDDTLTIIDRVSHSNKETIYLRDLPLLNGDLLNLIIKDRLGPSDLIINDLGQLLVVNSLDDSLMKVDLDKRVIIDIIKLGRFPNAIKLLNGKAYIINGDSNSLTIIDENEFNIIENIYIGGKPTDIQIDRDRSKAYIAKSDEFSIEVVDFNKSELERIDINSQPIKIIVSENILYILSYINNGITNFSNLSAIELDNYKLLWTEKLIGIFYDIIKRNTENYIYLVNPEDSYLYVFNILDKELERIIFLGGLPSIIETDNENELYISDSIDNMITIVDTKLKKITKKIRVGREPQGILLL